MRCHALYDSQGLIRLGGCAVNANKATVTDNLTDTLQ
jgi:hypothetical protein